MKGLIVSLFALIQSLFFQAILSPSPTLVPIPTVPATIQPTLLPTSLPKPTKPTVPSRVVSWSATPLTWEYFQGTPQSDYGAEIFTRMNVQWKDNTACTPSPPYSCTVRVSQFIIQALMDPKQSWVREDRKTSELLKHEQGHFDIGEIYARKIRAALAPYLGTSATAQADTVNSAREQASSQVDAKLNAILVPLQQAENQMQSDYDNETGHRIGNPAAQTAWEQKIKSML